MTTETRSLKSVVLLVLLLTVPAFSQVPINDEGDKSIAFSSYRTGKLHSNNGNNAAAITAYLESIRAFEEAGAKSELAYVMSELSTLYLFAADYRKAKQYSEQSLAILGALKSVERVSCPLTLRGEAAALSNLGSISKQEGEYDEALNYLLRSLAMFKQLDVSKSEDESDHITHKRLDEENPSAKVEIAFALTDIGRIYRVKGDHAQALHYLNQALMLARQRLMKFVLAGVLNSIAILYMEQGDYTKAAAFLDQSLGASVQDYDQLGVARVSLNIAVLHQRQGNHHEALKQFRTTLMKAEIANATEIVVAAQQGMGAVYQELGDYDKASEWLEKGLQQARGINDHLLVAELMWRNAELHHAKRDFVRAVTLADDAIKSAIALRLPIMTYLALTTKGKSCLSNKEYGKASQALTQAIDQIEVIRTQVVGGEQERQLFFENKVVAYDLMTQLLVEQNKTADALLYAEKAKGRVLLDVLRGGRVSIGNTMTSAQRREEEQLNQTIVELNKRLRDENLKPVPDAALLNNLRVQLHSARLNYESFQNALYAAQPRFGRTLESVSVGTEDFVQDKKHAVLEYVVTRERTFLFILTRGEQGSPPSLQVHTINIKREELTKKTSRFHRLMADRNPVFVEASRELYDLLVKPAEPQLLGKTTLCVIPDDSLWGIPFQALQPADGRYLIEDYSLYYAPSLRTLSEMAKHKNKKGKQESLIAFGNPVVGGEMVASLREAKRGESFDPLPEAEAEVTTLESLFGPQRSRVLIGAQADERSFKSLASTYDTIHLATHGVLDNSHPLYSYLLLSKAERGADDDGLLEAREIMNMNLDADMAVLSACETARGRVGAGEGVVGMAWAFFIAGVRTTVVSQWKVNSKATSELMVNFYKHLKPASTTGGVTKAGALRLAALEVMKDRRYSHPFYWASFVMIGSNG